MNHFTIVAIPAKHKYQVAKILRNRLYTLEDDLAYYKEMIGVYWKNCDVEKQTEQSELMFHNLNHCKTRARVIRKELKIIRETLKVLK